MKKFSIRQLEAARNNPSAFAASIKQGTLGSGQFGGRPKSVRWLDAIGVYHKTSNLSEAINSLERSFSNRINTNKNRIEIDRLIQALKNYVKEHKKYGYIYLEKAHPIEIILSTKVKLTGWIWLLNMTADGGRSGYIISKQIEDNTWKSELRFPIIQNYIANKIYGCNLNDVDVGLVDYLTGVHYRTRFSENIIKNSLKELTTIGNTITSLI
ncbi:MAG: hypothetical protein ABSA44_04275 [Bacteroidota bacterium]|jgi:hypothetical protein